MLANDSALCKKIAQVSKRIKMKIAYIIPGCAVSGGIAVICQHANRLLSRGHEVYLVSESIVSKMDWFPNQNVPILQLNQYPADIDIVVATGWSTSFRVVNLPARHKCYFVQSDETRFHPKGSEWEHITGLSYLLNLNYLTEARWIKNWLSENFGHEAQLVPNGLDQEIFYPTEPLRPKGKKPRVLLEGAIALPYKGMTEAFKAVEDLDVEVWCISSLGRPEPHWKCDRFFEQVPMNEMRRIYSSCDVLLKLSRVEGFFGPPMEMMACGGAVVVGKVTGYDEYIVDNENALVVDAADVAAAKGAVQRITSDNDLKERLIKNGRDTANLWQWEISIDALETYYLDLLSGKKGVLTTSKRSDIDKSISFFYFNLLGLTLNDSTMTVSSYTDRLCNKLKKMGWFNLSANLLGLGIKNYKKFKNRVI